MLNRLKNIGVRVSAALPPLISEPELRLRPAAEVAGRTMALLAVAVWAESRRSDDEPRTIDMLRGRLGPAFQYLTPREQAFLHEDAPSEKETMQMAWRGKAPAGIDPGVVTEPHHALNWLVRFEDAEWDDVDTPT